MLYSRQWLSAGAIGAVFTPSQRALFGSQTFGLSNFAWAFKLAALISVYRFPSRADHRPPRSMQFDEFSSWPSLLTGLD